MVYTNYSNISLPMAVWLAADHGYDLKFDPRVYSATTLLQPVRAVVLGRQVLEKQADGAVDISDLVPAAVGTAVHVATEHAWLYKRDQAMMDLGIASHIVDRIVMNAEHEDDPDAIYIYMEQRSMKEVDGVYISGKFDFVYEGRVKDIKTTKTYNWIHGGNDEKYAQQASIYRWLNSDIITDDYCDIEFLFTDWSPLKALADKKYPQKRVMTRTLPLMSLTDTEHFIKTKLAKIKAITGLNQANMPKCTPDELWMQPMKWAYYKNARSLVRATKLFNTEAEAITRNIADGSKGKIVKRISEPKFCNYCDARPICMQAANYINDGILKL